MNIIAKANSDGSVDLLGKQGSTWRFTITLKNEDNTSVDLTGYRARGHIKKNYSDANPTAIFTCSISNATEGEIQIYMSATQTAAIKCGKSPTDSASTYVYDIEIESASGEVSRVLEGKIFVDPEVTK